MQLYLFIDIGKKKYENKDRLIQRGGGGRGGRFENLWFLSQI